jgi:hypothetical protein
MEFFNWGKYTIDFFAYIGLCSNRKIASPELVAKRSLRTGDGSKYYDPHYPEPELWENNNEKEDVKDIDEDQNNNQPTMVKNDISNVPEIFKSKSCEYEFYSKDVVKKSN